MDFPICCHNPRRWLHRACDTDIPTYLLAGGLLFFLGTPAVFALFRTAKAEDIADRMPIILPKWNAALWRHMRVAGGCPTEVKCNPERTHRGFNTPTTLWKGPRSTSYFVGSPAEDIPRLHIDHREDLDDDDHTPNDNPSQRLIAPVVLLEDLPPIIRGKELSAKYRPLVKDFQYNGRYSASQPKPKKSKLLLPRFLNGARSVVVSCAKYAPLLVYGAFLAMGIKCVSQSRSCDDSAKSMGVAKLVIDAFVPAILLFGYLTDRFEQEKWYKKNELLFF